MEEHDERAPVGLEASLEHMDCETVDVLDDAGADAGWERGLAVGWKVACLHTNDGRILRDRRTANRRGRGCQWRNTTRHFRPVDRREGQARPPLIVQTKAPCCCGQVHPKCVRKKSAPRLRESVDNTNSKGGPMEQLFTADPGHPAIIMAQSGKTIRTANWRRAANKIAHLLRAMGLKRSDHSRRLHGEPSALHRMRTRGRALRASTAPTSIRFSRAGELAYIVNNSLSQVLITSRAHLAVARQARRCSTAPA